MASDECQEFRGIYGRIEDGIQKLPSVTPKPIECEDAISREAVQEAFADYVASGFAESVADFEAYTDIVMTLPSVTQKSGKWIPVNERIPKLSIQYHPYDEKSSNYVLVTVEGQIWPKKQTQVKLARYSYDYKKWIITNNNYGKITAWMPLPKPYEPQERSGKE